MSYNISSIQTKKCTLTISAEDARKFVGRRGELPEYSQFTSDKKFLHLVENATDPDARVPFGDDFKWSGIWSGHAMHTLTDEIFPATEGELEAAVAWAGGDAIERWIVKEGNLERVPI